MGGGTIEAARAAMLRRMASITTPRCLQTSGRLQARRGRRPYKLGRPCSGRPDAARGRPRSPRRRTDEGQAGPAGRGGGRYPAGAVGAAQGPGQVQSEDDRICHRPRRHHGRRRPLRGCGEAVSRRARDPAHPRHCRNDSPTTAGTLSQLGAVLIFQRKSREAAAVYAELDKAIANWEPQRRQVFELNPSRILSLYNSGQLDAGLPPPSNWSRSESAGSAKITSMPLTRAARWRSAMRRQARCRCHPGIQGGHSRS